MDPPAVTRVFPTSSSGELEFLTAAFIAVAIIVAVIVYKNKKRARFVSITLFSFSLQTLASYVARSDHGRPQLAMLSPSRHK